MLPRVDLDHLSPADLKRLVVTLMERIAGLEHTVAALREELARLKGLKGPPSIKPSGMEQASGDAPPKEGRRKRRRRGRGAANLSVHEDRVVKVAVPAGSRFKGYEDFLVQDVIVRAHVIRYRRERWLTPDGQTVIAPLPAGIAGHCGADLRRYVLALYHQGQLTVPRLVEHLASLGLRVSKRQIVRLLTDQAPFIGEARAVLRAGLRTARWISVDDTGARHKAVNGVCTQIGDDRFTAFATTSSKSRLNFLDVLRAGYPDYAINAEALDYLRSRALPQHAITRLAEHPCKRFADEGAWCDHLHRLGIDTLRHSHDAVRLASEGGLWGSIKAHGFLPDTVILSDDAGQFAVGQHALCWVHAERLVHELDLHRCGSGRSGARAGPDLVVLPRSQGVLPRAHGATARRAQGALRPDLPAAHRVRHARPSPGTAARQQGGAADGAAAPRGAAAHQRLGERRPLSGHPAQDLRRHALR